MKSPYQWILLAVLGTGLLGLGVAFWGQRSPTAVAPGHVADFLQQHWQVPIPLQGPPLPHYSPLETSLHPKDCGLCHPQQFQDWRTSIHSRSMGPGVYGQLLDMAQSDPATYTLCATCHTPLSEQIPHQQQGPTYRSHAVFDAALQQAGLVCAGCHVRQHTRFGPPRRPELPALPPGTPLPHGGFVESVAFQRSEFCKNCHQFGPDGFALKGKPLENTYAEWQESPYAAAGVQCQYCHMPDRRHLWQGIHDPAMVKQAMTVTISPRAASYEPGETVHVTITVANTGAGHYLPTYVTPKIFVEAHLLDGQGQSIADSAQQTAIGREVTPDLSQELYDTRIPPKASHMFTYTHVLPATAMTLQVRVVVHPDHFYRQFFAVTLADGSGGQGRAYLQAALHAAEASPFTVFARDVPLRQTSQ